MLHSDAIFGVMCAIFGGNLQFPVLVGLVGQILRLAGNGVNLPACSAYFRDNPCIDVAP